MTLKLKKMIRQAIDTLPEGLHFSRTDGFPILSNKKMDDLVYHILGHTIVDGEQAWKELESLRDDDRAHRLETVQREGEEELVFRLADGRIWRFTRTLLAQEGQQYVQIQASDMTDLYALRENLSESKERLTRQTERQNAMLKEIVKNNHEREVLTFKSQVHDELGNCILATRQALAEDSLELHAEQLRRLWQKSICSFTNIPLEHESIDRSNGEEELRRVAKLIGCEIQWEGQPPVKRKVLRLLHMAMREALVNAVRHGGADRLCVKGQEKKGWYEAAISDNGAGMPGDTAGSADAFLLPEGNGLSNLRKRLEAEGAWMKVEGMKRPDGGYGRSVILRLGIPTEEQEVRT